MSVLTIVMSVAILLSAACSHQGVSSGDTKTIPNKPNQEHPVITAAAERLHTPWAIQFDGDTVYMSERDGTIAKIDGGTMVRQRVNLKKPLKIQGEGGFLGLALAPDFHTTGQAYSYHTYEEEGKVYNRLVLLRETLDGWDEVKAYLERIPGAFTHNGGRLAIGPDNKLYITTGDAGQGNLAQDLNSYAGKILRVSLDGTIPSDNPLSGSYVYSYGHRNPQGIAWDSKGRMYSSEHGPSGNPGGHDEMNLIEPGSNYGWPDIIGDDKKEGMVSPLYHTGDTAIAPSGIAIDADNQIVVAALKGEKLFKYDPAAHTMTTLLENEGRLRDVKIHSGSIYVITNNTDGRGKPAQNDDRLLVISYSSLP